MIFFIFPVFRISFSSNRRFSLSAFRFSIASCASASTWSLKGQLFGTPGSFLLFINFPGFFFFSFLIFLACSLTFFSTLHLSLVDWRFDCFLQLLPFPMIDLENIEDILKRRFFWTNANNRLRTLVAQSVHIFMVID